MQKIDKAFAYEFIKKMVLTWDPDFTKLTKDEEKEFLKAEKSGFTDENHIDWEQIGIDNK